MGAPPFQAWVCHWWLWVLCSVWGGGPWFVCVRVLCVLWCWVCACSRGCGVLGVLWSWWGPR